MLKYLVLIILLCIGIVFAEEKIDSTKTPLVIDTLLSDTLSFDTTGIDVDTLSEGQKVYLQFLNRRAKRKDEQVSEKKEFKTYLSFYDSLVVAFLHPRLNGSSEIKRSFAKDAGDFFKTDPSYFVKDFQQTPSRKTVRPFGLSGNRLNVISDGLSLTPFEHILEPDGLVDFNDIPTGLTKDIYVLPGSIGQLFGGDQSIATLVTVPSQPKSLDSEIKLQVDKGGYDYAFTRGGYTKLFSDGKEVDLSVDYRNTYGIRSNTDDNGKHYAGRTLIPLNSSYYIDASGSSYRRKGSYKSSTISGSPYITRSRTDRNGHIAIEKLNESQNVKYHLGYGYIKQNSNIDIAYKGRFNFFGNEINFARESLLGNKLLKTEISYSYLKQTDGLKDDSEKSAKAILSLLQKNDQSSFGLVTGTIYNDDYKFLPFFSSVYQIYSENNFLMLSLGYSEKAPSMHDQNLVFQQTTFYPTGLGYADVGNKWLLSEKQLVGSLMYEYGSLKNNLRLSVTGGFIQDGIDWYHIDTVVGSGTIKLFRPKNSDILFTDFQLKQKFSVGDFLNLSLGGAYHYIDYDIIENRAYQPDYQLFFGGEIHHYWKQKIMDLFLYGETVFEGPYKGYFGEKLGENVIVNTGLAFEIKKFRFYYIFQNSIEIRRANPDAFNNFGQFSYYGLTWYFMN